MSDYSKLIEELIALPREHQDLSHLKEIKRTFCKKNKLADLPPNTTLLREYRNLLKNWDIKKNEQIEIILRKRAIRSQSWIISVQVLTKPFPCPGKCIFCPNEKDMPKSYLKSEPWAMRAWLNQFDPHKQVRNRLLSLTQTWHKTDKIEMIVLWWTWDVYPDDYKIEFVRWLYDACNTFSEFLERVEYPEENKDWNKIQNWNTHDKRFSFHVNDLEWIQYSKNIEEAIKINESASNRIIWLTIETRPEFVTDKNCLFRRELWVTRIEMWIQSLYDDVLEANKRWHNVDCINNAMHKLRQYWFKISVHIMPWLYKSNKEKDIWTFTKLYNDPFLKPDEIKLYPTSVIPWTELNELYKKGEYIPLETEDINKLIEEVLLKKIPPYTRIKRLIRDIPTTEIVAWSKVTNLSQLTRDKMKSKMKINKYKNIFYTRLYDKYELFEKFDIRLPHFEIDNNTNKNKTYIIWQQPDLVWYRNFVSLDTRSREIRNRLPHPGEEILEKHKSKFVNQIIRIYESSVGLEFFISFEDELGYLYWFTRLLLPKESEIIEIDWLGQNTAIIRELHVYWKLESLKINDNLTGTNWQNHSIQHQGFGKQLMQSAEKISKFAWYKRLSVISGVWVRGYYEKLWYKLEGTYIVKEI